MLAEDDLSTALIRESLPGSVAPSQAALTLHCALNGRPISYSQQPVKHLEQNHIIL